MLRSNKSKQNKNTNKNKNKKKTLVAWIEQMVLLRMLRSNTKTKVILPKDARVCQQSTPSCPWKTLVQLTTTN
jgi:hypothetical protein